VLDLELPAGLTARPARPGDAGAIADLLMRGFATYADWAPDWSSPDDLDALQHHGWARSLAQPDRWTAVVEAHGRITAVCSFGQAMTAPGGDGDPIPAMAHVGAVFVDREWWGRGIARALLGVATAEIASRGFEQARLIVPEGNERARRLYARNGWETVGTWDDERLGLPLLELRLRLGRR
jgi:ribosomal protein S18 acetylase RimI-like enzyme